MPLVKTFQGRPIKRMANVKQGILLIFYSPIAGARGDRKIITQEEWDSHGSIEYVTTAGKPNLRELAARFS